MILNIRIRKVGERDPGRSCKRIRHASCFSESHASTRMNFRKS